MRALEHINANVAIEICQIGATCGGTRLPDVRLAQVELYESNLTVEEGARSIRANLRKK